jgi:hypothetical protein
MTRFPGVRSFRDARRIDRGAPAIAQLHRQSIGGPYKRVEFSWILENNRDINQPAEEAGARRYKTYRIFEKALV